MATPTTFIREAGSGPGVLCLHSNASSSSQWRALMERLAPAFHVLATDGYGAGQGPAWPQDRPIGLADEAALLAPAFERAGSEPVALVGHSYGAAVALVAASARPERIAALVLYEPTLFSLLDAERPPPNEADGIRAAVAGSVAALASGDSAEAARCFIDYWMGAGSFDRMPPARQAPIQAAVANVAHWARALLGEQTPLATLRTLRMPLLLLRGSASPASSLGVARLLADALPHAEVTAFEGLGHMGPVTHPEVVNEAIERFLRRAMARP